MQHKTGQRGVGGWPGIPGRIRSEWVGGCCRYRWADKPECAGSVERNRNVVPYAKFMLRKALIMNDLQNARER